jgi:hypothetical protein
LERNFLAFGGVEGVAEVGWGFIFTRGNGSEFLTSQTVFSIVGKKGGWVGRKKRRGGESEGKRWLEVEK